MCSNSAEEQSTHAWRNQQPMKFGGRYGHGSAKIDEHRMIIVGGRDAVRNILSSGFIYDVRTQQSTPLRHDMPAEVDRCCVVANDGFVYVIGGFGSNGSVNTMYRLCLKTQEWTIMAPMATARCNFASTLKDNYIYVFGGCGINGWLSSSERYCIDNNTWKELPDMPKQHRSDHCAVATTDRKIYIVGGIDTCSIDVFDIATITWEAELDVRDMPELLYSAAGVVLKKRYVVVIGGGGNYRRATASCLIYDIWSNLWSSTPKSMEMINRRDYHTAAVLDEKIVVAGGRDRDYNVLASVECIDIDCNMPLSIYIIHCRIGSSIEFLKLVNLKGSIFLVQSLIRYAVQKLCILDLNSATTRPIILTKLVSFYSY